MTAIVDSGTINLWGNSFSHTETNTETLRILKSQGGDEILKSLDLALRVLESFGDGRHERGVTDLADELSTNKATVYRVLSTLQSRNYLVQDPANRRYRLGPRLIHMGHLATGQTNLPAEARPYMEALRDQTEETADVAVIDGGDLLYLAAAESPQSMQVVLKVGDRAPVHCVSAGKVLLAYADSSFVERLVEQGLIRYTEFTYTDPDALASELGAIRRQGYAINWGEYRTEIRGIAAPIVDGSQCVVAALDICGPSSRLTEEKIAACIPLVVDAAFEISVRLGAPSSGSLTELASSVSRNLWRPQ